MSKKITLNKIRTSSLFKSSLQTIETEKRIPLNPKSSKTILREIYEGLSSKVNKRVKKAFKNLRIKSASAKKYGESSFFKIA